MSQVPGQKENIRSSSSWPVSRERSRGFARPVPQTLPESPFQARQAILSAESATSLRAARTPDVWNLSLYPDATTNMT